MSFRQLVIYTRRKLSTLLLLGIFSCLIILVLLTYCNGPSESEHKGHIKTKNDVEEENHFNDQLDILIATNLLIIVMSAPEHFDVRNTIRETWAQNLPNGATVKFVVGTKNLSPDLSKHLLKENASHADLVLLVDLEESYSSLTSKLLSALKFVQKHVKYNFFMKVDEDTFVRVESVLEELLSKPQRKLYWGFFDGRAHVKRSGKWMEKDYILCDRYLPYALGGGYVISKDLVEYVTKNSEILKQFNSEDVSLGTWLGALDINRVHDVNFDTEYKSRGCYNSYLVTHKKTVEDLRQLKNNLNTLGTLCVEEKRARLSYQYKWNGLPTKCCERTDYTIP